MRFRIFIQLAILLLLTVTPLSWADVIAPRSNDLFASTWPNDKPGESHIRCHFKGSAPDATKFSLAIINVQARPAGRNDDSFLGSTLALVDMANRPDRATPSFMQSAASQPMPSTFSLSVVRRMEADQAMEFFSLSGMGTTSQLSSSTAGISTMVLPPASTSPSGQSSWITLSTVNLGW